MIDRPEVYFAEPTKKEEKHNKEMYEYYYSKIGRHIHVPPTIDTFTGKVRFLRDTMRTQTAFRQGGTWGTFILSLKPADEKSEEAPDYFSDLQQQRKKAIEKLDSLTPEEVEELRAKARALAESKKTA